MVANRLLLAPYTRAIINKYIKHLAQKQNGAETTEPQENTTDTPSLIRAYLNCLQLVKSLIKITFGGRVANDLIAAFYLTFFSETSQTAEVVCGTRCCRCEIEKKNVITDCLLAGDSFNNM